MDCQDIKLIRFLALHASRRHTTEAKTIVEKGDVPVIKRADERSRNTF